jgi:hypothetical protein
LVGWWGLTNVVTAHVAFWQSEELVAFGTCLHDFFEGEVHVGVALDQVAVESLAVLELDEHGVALGGGEEAERELVVVSRVVVKAMKMGSNWAYHVGLTVRSCWVVCKTY